MSLECDTPDDHTQCISHIRCQVKRARRLEKEALEKDLHESRAERDTALTEVARLTALTLELIDARDKARAALSSFDEMVGDLDPPDILVHWHSDRTKMEKAVALLWRAVKTENDVARKRLASDALDVLR